MISSDVGQRLRQAGLRVTAPRQSVLQWLAACTAAGLVRRIEPAGHPARFERRTGDNHHHVVCRSCGRTEDVDCAVDLRPCLTPSADHGYLLDEAEVVFWGTCPSCQTAAPAGPWSIPVR